MQDIHSLRFILHVSDFHLSEKACETDVAQNALNAIVEKLREQDINIDYLVHTGDVINSSDLHQAAAEASGILEKYQKSDSGIFDFERFTKEANDGQKKGFNRYIRQKTKNRFEAAEKVFREFISNLNVSFGNVIICCGNHDAMRLAFLDKDLPTCEAGDFGDRQYCLSDNQESIYDTNLTHFSSETESVFEPFYKFLDNLNVANSANRNKYRKNQTGENGLSIISHCTLGNLNFLILNTNWRNPSNVKSPYYCIRCDQVSEAIEQADHGNINKANMLNIVVAHKPIYEICETARLPYKRYIKTSFMSSLQNFIGEHGIYLCGDKHTRSVIGASFHDIPHYIGGEPFTVKNTETNDYEVEYNLLGIADGKLGMERKIHLRSTDGNTWTCDIRPQDAVVSKIYNLSKGHISPESYASIGFSAPRNTWEALNQKLYQTRTNSLANDERLNVFFKSISKYRIHGEKEYKWKNNTASHEIKDNIFKFICGRIQSGISDSTNKNILNLRGEYSSGKSTFLGLMYIYLLQQYSIGAINFIPAYFALENAELIKKIECSSSYYNAVKQAFTEFADNIHQISCKERQPVCFIIDRLDEQDCWSFSSEDSVGRGLLDVLSKYDDAWYIMSFGQHYLPHFKNTMPVRKYSDRSDVLYFNPIDVMDNSVENTDNRFEQFVETYIELKTGSKHVEKTRVEDVCNLIRKFRRLTIAPGFMRQNFSFITESKSINDPNLRNADASVSQVYRYYIDRQYERCLHRLGYGFVDYAPAMAYLFSYQGYTYERFEHIRDDITLRNRHALKPISDNQDKIYKTFMFIKKHKDSREYLVALYYHRELRYYAEHPSQKIDSDSILNEFISRNIAVLIRKMWTDTNKFVIVCKKLMHRDELSNCTLSMLLYCLAHISMYEPIRDQLRDELNALAKKALDRMPYQSENSWKIPNVSGKKRLQYFLDLSLKHTMEIFSSICDKNSVALVNNLINDEEFARYNRQHQMLYYQDLTIREEDKIPSLDPGKDIIHKGFDFYHCFNYLYVKVCGTDPYPLKEFDLYTICDLFMTRLDPSDENIRVHPGKKSVRDDTFFYWKDGYERVLPILQQARSVLSNFLESHPAYDDEADEEAINKMKEYFNNTLNRINGHIADIESTLKEHA